MENIHILTLLDVIRQDLHIDMIQGDLTSNRIEEIFKEAILLIIAMNSRNGNSRFGKINILLITTYGKRNLLKRYYTKIISK